MSQQTRTQLKNDVDSNLADGGRNTAGDVRGELKDVIDSMASRVDGIDASNLNSGTVPDGRVSKSSIVQHDFFPHIPGGVIAPGLSDPIYKISNYADLFDATNQVFDDVLSENLKSPIRIFWPQGDYRPTSGSLKPKIISSNRNKTAVIQGAGRWKTDIAVDGTSGFPDEPAIDANPANQGLGGTTGSGLVLRDFSLREFGNSVQSRPFVDIIDYAGVEIYRTLINSADAPTILSVTSSSAGDDFFYAENIKINGVNQDANSNPQVGVKYTGNVAEIAGKSRINGDGAGTGVGYDFSQSNFAFLRGDISKVGTGCKLGSNSTAMLRFESPGGDVPVCYDVQGENNTIISRGDYYRYSKDKGIYNDWVSKQLQEIHSLALTGGGANLPGAWDYGGGGTPSLDLSNGRVRVTGNSGNNAHLDLAGNAPWRDASVTQPTWNFVLDLENSANTIVRGGLFEASNPTSNYIGVFHDEDGSNTWRIRSVVGGTMKVDFDGGFAAGRGVRASISIDNNGNVHIAMRDKGRGVAVQRKTIDSADTPDLTAVYPRFLLQNDAGGSRHLEVWHSEAFQRDR